MMKELFENFVESCCEASNNFALSLQNEPVSTKKTIDVLGTEYTIIKASKAEDKALQEIDSYCDKTSKKIVVTMKDDDCDLDCFEVYQKKCIRHEIIHAFLFESGLHENFQHKPYGHDETYVDWIAVQFPKLLKAFQDADAL